MKKLVLLAVLFCLTACDKKIDDMLTKSDIPEEEQNDTGLKPPVIEVDTTTTIIDDIINIKP